LDGDAAGFFFDKAAVGAALFVVQLNDDALVRALDDDGLGPRDLRFSIFDFRFLPSVM
jgi:hypothetical protein